MTAVGFLPSELRGSVRSWCDVSSDRSLMLDPLNYVSFQPVLHDCKTKAVVCLWDGEYKKLLIGKSSPCSDGSR